MADIQAGCDSEFTGTTGGANITFATSRITSPDVVKALFMLTANNASASAVGSGAEWSFGFGISNTDRVALGAASEDGNTGTSDSKRAQSVSLVVGKAATDASGFTWEGDVDAAFTHEAVIDMQSAPATSAIMHGLMIGGSDVEASRGEVTGLDSNSSRTIDPGLSGAADVILFGWANLNSTGDGNNGLLGLGCATNESGGIVNKCSYWASQNGQANSNTFAYHADGHCALHIPASGSAVDMDARVTSFTAGAGSDQITLTVDNQGGGSVARLQWLALKLNGGDFALKEFTHATSGNRDISVGFTQEAAILSIAGATVADTITAGNAGSITIADDSDVNYGIAWHDEDAVGTTNTDSHSGQRTTNSDDMAFMPHDYSGTIYDATVQLNASADTATITYTSNPPSAFLGWGLFIGKAAAGTANPHNPLGHPLAGVFGGPI